MSRGAARSVLALDLGAAWRRTRGGPASDGVNILAEARERAKQAKLLLAAGIEEEEDSDEDDEDGEEEWPAVRSAAPRIGRGAAGRP